VTPNNPQISTFSKFFIAFLVFTEGEVRDFELGRYVDVASASQRMTNRPRKGRGQVTWTI